MPVGDNCEIDRLVLTNESDAPKSFTVFSYLEFCLWECCGRFHQLPAQFLTGEVEVEGSTIYHKTEYRERRNHYALFTVNTPIDGFDTSRDVFRRMAQQCEPRGRGKTAAAPTLLPTAGHPLACIKSMSPCSPAKAAAWIFVFGLYRKPRGREVGRAWRHQ